MDPVRTLFDEETVARRVAELAEAVAAEFSPDLLMVGILKGAFVFMADLMRALDRLGLRPGVEFIRLSSYGQSKESAGEVRLVTDLRTDLRGRQVLLVDDICDTGHSLAFAARLLAERGATLVRTCVLVDKPSRRVVDFAADFIGFTVEDVFIVGYGIDYAEQYRHLPYIGTVD